MATKNVHRLVSWINQKDLKETKITIKRTKCFFNRAFSFLPQEDVFKIFNMINQLIRSSFLMELISLKANKLFNLSFSNRKIPFIIIESENLQKI